MNKPVIVFCQAPADIPYALSIYESLKKNNQKFHFFIVNVKGMYYFLQSLNLQEVTFSFLPYSFVKNFKNPINIIIARIYLKKIFNKYFQGLKNNDVYYFCNIYDFLTTYLISKLSRNNKIYFINHYDDIALNNSIHKFDYKNVIYKIIYFIITGIFFKFVQFSAKNYGYVFKYYKYPIRECKILINEIIYSNFKYNISPLFNNSVLFIISKNNYFESPQNYRNVLESIIKKIKSYGNKIIVKGHPRLGFPEIFIPYTDLVIPDFVPSEFIDTEKIKYVIGDSSTALAIIANRGNAKVFSVLNLYDFKDSIEKKYVTNYLTSLSQKIIYLQNIKGINV